MGSSYRSDLNLGHMKTWEIKLREAIKQIKEVIEEIYEYAGDDGQYDNAFDEGFLAGRLSIAIDIIRSELPKEKV